MGMDIGVVKITPIVCLSRESGSPSPAVARDEAPQIP